MSKLLTVSPSPHDYSKDTVPKLMYRVIFALLPALAVSIFYFGIGAIVITCIAVISCLIFEYVIQKYILKTPPSILDGSAIVTGILLAFNLPSSLPVWMVILGSLVAIGIGKLTFGGLGNNPFNPALVGRVFLLVSFPAQMTTWPVALETRATNWLQPVIEKTIDGETVKMLGDKRIDAITGATPLGIIKEGVKNGEKVSAIMEKIPDSLDMLLGYMGGSLGEIAAFALLLGLLYMLWKNVITIHIPLSILLTVFLFTGILWLANPEKFANPVFHVLTGGLLLGAIFMATDYVTSPMTAKGMWIFGIGIGIITVLIRIFGSYPEGVSFAILIMNAFVPLLNKIPPKRFGKGVKNV